MSGSNADKPLFKRIVVKLSGEALMGADARLEDRGGELEGQRDEADLRIVEMI